MGIFKIERIDPIIPYHLIHWRAIGSDKTYDFIIEDIPKKRQCKHLKGCKELYIRDKEFNTWQHVSPEFIEMLSENNNELFESLIMGFETIKAKTPKNKT